LNWDVTKSGHLCLFKLEIRTNHLPDEQFMLSIGNALKIHSIQKV